MSKLWIIGDSFTGGSIDGKSAWTEIVSEKYKGSNYYVSSKPSRDFQTILDIFLRNLKNISKYDFVILTVPTIGRTRLPLETPLQDVELSNFIDKTHAFDYFIGTSSYIKESETYSLEKPLTGMDEVEMRESCNMWSIVNDSTASKKNYIEILKSFKEYFPFKIFIWSWENEINSELIVNKNQIIEKMGFWETLNDEWENTNGISGKKGDAHWSKKTHKAFANYIINKFPEYFTK